MPRYNIGGCWLEYHLMWGREQPGWLLFNMIQLTASPPRRARLIRQDDIQPARPGYYCPEDCAWLHHRILCTEACIAGDCKIIRKTNQTHTDRQTSARDCTHTDANKCTCTHTNKYTCTHTDVNKYTCTHTDMNKCTCTHTNKCTCTHTNMCTCTHTDTNKYTCTHTDVNKCTCTHTDVNKCTCTHTDANTHKVQYKKFTHTYTRF